MDKSNLHDVVAMAPGNEAIAKVKLLLGNKEVPDPILMTPYLSRFLGWWKLGARG